MLLRFFTRIIASFGSLLFSLSYLFVSNPRTGFPMALLGGFLVGLHKPHSMHIAILVTGGTFGSMYGYHELSQYSGATPFLQVFIATLIFGCSLGCIFLALTWSRAIQKKSSTQENK
ncbi:MAG: hypothetical protein HQM09_23880 [Candidatus Riflebacteria bacterium]|nr:hypothetical protein [Candidatus Riflebacteria bacterium]